MKADKKYINKQMSISPIAINIIFSVITIAASILIGIYFHKKGKKRKELVPYIHYISKVITDIDPELRKFLKIEYKDVPVKNIYEVQFVISNNGDKPITGGTERVLSLPIPNKGKLLDAKITYVDPEGRQVEYNIRNENGIDIIEYNFRVLNPKEYFVSKIFVREDFEEKERGHSEFLNIEDFKFAITEEELPPVINAKKYSKEKGQNSRDKSEYLGGSLGYFLFGSFMFLGVLLGGGTKELLGDYLPAFVFIMLWYIGALLLFIKYVLEVRKEKNPDFHIP
jgi:hypothetical protein